MSIHFGEDKTKEQRISVKSIKYKDINIKHYVTYFGCMLDEMMSREPMALKVINEINDKLKFLYRKNRFPSPELQRMLCSVFIQPHFNYACPAWYPNLKTKKKIQIMQSNCIRFYLRVDKMYHISEEDFRLINLLPTSKRVDQCINTTTFKFVNNTLSERDF